MALHLGGLPAPVVQHPVIARSARYYLDLAYPEVLRRDRVRRCGAPHPASGPPRSDSRSRVDGGRLAHRPVRRRRGAVPAGPARGGRPRGTCRPRRAVSVGGGRGWSARDGSMCGDRRLRGHGAVATTVRARKRRLSTTGTRSQRSRRSRHRRSTCRRADLVIAVRAVSCVGYQHPRVTYVVRGAATARKQLITIRPRAPPGSVTASSTAGSAAGSGGGVGGGLVGGGERRSPEPWHQGSAGITDRPYASIVASLASCIA